MAYDLPNGYLSASAIGTLLACPRQYEYHYMKGMKLPSNRSLSTGSILHKSFEYYYRDAMRGTGRYTGRQLAEATMDELLPNWFSGNENTVSPPERAAIEGVVPSVVESYADNVGQYIVPLQVEQEVRVTMKNGVEIRAFLDLVRAREGRSDAIVDYKFTGRGWTVQKLQSTLQFMLYAYITGMNDVQIHNVVLPKSGRPVRMAPVYREMDAKSSGAYSFESGQDLRIVGNEFPATQGAYLEDLVESCAKMISAGIFPPCSPANWCCTPTWCGYWRLCRGAHGA